MKYVIYEIQNEINGKIYIGKHKTHDENDAYMGSGKLLRKAIKKYGIENFSKRILYVFETEKEMNLAERILVVEDVEISYNLCPGGQGGWEYINKSELNLRFNKEFQKSVSPFGTKEFNERHRESFRKGGQIGFKGKRHSNEAKLKMSLKSKNRQHSDETKERIRATLKARKMQEKEQKFIESEFTTASVAQVVRASA